VYRWSQSWWVVIIQMSNNAFLLIDQLKITTKYFALSQLRYYLGVIRSHTNESNNSHHSWQIVIFMWQYQTSGSNIRWMDFIDKIFYPHDSSECEQLGCNHKSTIHLNNSNSNEPSEVSSFHYFYQRIGFSLSSIGSFWSIFFCFSTETEFYPK
jgi:hypothetical protein